MGTPIADQSMVWPCKPCGYAYTLRHHENCDRCGEARPAPPPEAEPSELTRSEAMPTSLTITSFPSCPFCGSIDLKRRDGQLLVCVCVSSRPDRDRWWRENYVKWDALLAADRATSVRAEAMSTP